MKVAIYTLGCKVNQYETQAMEQTLRAKGHQVVEFSDEADAYVVNTCSVTAVSDQKSRQVIHRVQKQHPAAVVAVCGCYPQTHPEDVRKLGADLIRRNAQVLRTKPHIFFYYSTNDLIVRILKYHSRRLSYIPKFIRITRILSIYPYGTFCWHQNCIQMLGKS